MKGLHTYKAHLRIAIYCKLLKYSFHDKLSIYCISVKKVSVANILCDNFFTWIFFVALCQQDFSYLLYLRKLFYNFFITLPSLSNYSIRLHLDAIISLRIILPRYVHIIIPYRCIFSEKLWQNVTGSKCKVNSDNLFFLFPSYLAGGPIYISHISFKKLFQGDLIYALLLSLLCKLS